VAAKASTDTSFAASLPRRGGRVAGAEVTFLLRATHVAGLTSKSKAVTKGSIFQLAHDVQTENNASSFTLSERQEVEKVGAYSNATNFIVVQRLKCPSEVAQYCPNCALAFVQASVRRKEAEREQSSINAVAGAIAATSRDEPTDPKHRDEAYTFAESVLKTKLTGMEQDCAKAVLKVLGKRGHRSFDTAASFTIRLLQNILAEAAMLGSEHDPGKTLDHTVEVNLLIQLAVFGNGGSAASQGGSNSNRGPSVMTAVGTGEARRIFETVRRKRTADQSLDSLSSSVHEEVPDNFSSTVQEELQGPCEAIAQYMSSGQGDADQKVVLFGAVHTKGGLEAAMNAQLEPESVSDDDSRLQHATTDDDGNLVVERPNSKFGIGAGVVLSQSQDRAILPGISPNSYHASIACAPLYAGSAEKRGTCADRPSDVLTIAYQKVLQQLADATKVSPESDAYHSAVATAAETIAQVRRAWLSGVDNEAIANSVALASGVGGFPQMVERYFAAMAALDYFTNAQASVESPLRDPVRTSYPRVSSFQHASNMVNGTESAKESDTNPPADDPDSAAASATDSDMNPPADDPDGAAASAKDSDMNPPADDTDGATASRKGMKRPAGGDGRVRTQSLRPRIQATVTQQSQMVHTRTMRSGQERGNTNRAAPSEGSVDKSELRRTRRPTLKVREGGAQSAV
jgi:hypothetical protein